MEIGRRERTGRVEARTPVIRGVKRTRREGRRGITNRRRSERIGIVVVGRVGIGIKQVIWDQAGGSEPAGVGSWSSSFKAVH
jgi:hypothetical protein